MKKIMLLVLGVFLTTGGVTPAEAALTTPTISKLDERLVGDAQVRGDRLYAIGGDRGFVMYDLKTGALLRQFENGYGGDTVAVSSDEKHVVLVKDYSLNLYNTFGEVEKTIKNLGDDQTEMTRFDGSAFLPSTSTLIVSGEDKLTAYDVATGEVKWMRGADSGDVVTSNNYILVQDGVHGRLYTHEGEFVQEWRDIDSISLSLNDRLVVATNDTVSSYEAHLYEAPKHQLAMNAWITRMEPSGQFVVLNYEIYSFDLKKIHLAQSFNEKTVSLTANGKYMLVGGWYETNVYATNGFTERPISAYVPTAFQKLTAGKTYNASLTVKTASGKTISVKEGVTWTTNSPQIAYIKDGKIVAKSKGTVTLKASYEGIIAQRTVTVLPDPRPSDHSWLSSQKAQLIRGTFVGSPHKLYGNYANVKGAVGTFESDWDFGYKGRHQGDFMYTSTSKPQKINIITMSPSLQKRDITKVEFQRVFGRPRHASENYWETFMFTRAGKTLSETYIQEVAEYKINNKLPMYVFYDSNNRVRYISLYSK